MLGWREEALKSAELFVKRVGRGGGGVWWGEFCPRMHSCAPARRPWALVTGSSLSCADAEKTKRAQRTVEKRGKNDRPCCKASSETNLIFPQRLSRKCTVIKNRDHTFCCNPTISFEVRHTKPFVS